MVLGFGSDMTIDQYWSHLLNKGYGNTAINSLRGNAFQVQAFYSVETYLGLCVQILCFEIHFHFKEILEERGVRGKMKYYAHLINQFLDRFCGFQVTFSKLMTHPD